MTAEELFKVGEDLKAFVEHERLTLKLIDGWNLETFKAVSNIIHSVIYQLDDLKAKFADITNEQLQSLAVDAVYKLLDDLLKVRLSGVGKFLYSLVSEKLKKKLCATIVDFIVHALHSAKKKALAMVGK